MYYGPLKDIGESRNYRVSDINNIQVFRDKSQVARIVVFIINNPRAVIASGSNGTRVEYT